MKIYIKVITKSQRYNKIPMYTGSVPGKTIKISKRYNKNNKQRLCHKNLGSEMDP